MMDKVRLIIKGVSEIMGNEKIGLIFLTDNMFERQISIVCDWDTAQEINIRLKRKIDKSTSLPEVMAKMIAARTKYEPEYSIYITGIESEQYKTYIIGEDTGEMHKIKASDATLLSLVMNIPIYIDKTLMQKQSISNKSRQDRATIPINVVKSSILEETLERAINEEDYETASKIHSELERRKREKNGNGNDTDTCL